MIQKSGKLIFTVALLAGTILPATPAFAQATRTWVSGNGDDANPCSRTAPCKTFAGAISKTADKGEINCIDSGGFGTLTITKNITIDCPGVMASVLAGGVNGLTINAAGVTVTLRNLTVQGAGFTTGNGIRIVAAGAVNIDHVVIENFAGTGTNGVGVVVASSAAATKVKITNSQIYNNGQFGIQVQPTAGNVILDMDRTDVSHSGSSGIALFNSVTATITNSNLTDNISGAGLATQDATVTAFVGNSVIANNSIGVANGTAGAAAVTRLYGTVITGNTANGLQISGGSVFTHGNNGISGNGGNQTPTQPSIGQQ